MISGSVADKHEKIFVVGLGASAGGTQALMAYVVNNMKWRFIPLVYKCSIVKLNRLLCIF